MTADAGTEGWRAGPSRRPTSLLSPKRLGGGEEITMADAKDNTRPARRRAHQPNRVLRGRILDAEIRRQQGTARRSRPPGRALGESGRGGAEQVAGGPAWAVGPRIGNLMNDDAALIERLNSA